MNTYEKALEFATKKHEGQFRNNGEPYINHPIRVASMVKTDYQKICALLHDVLEDTDTTEKEIIDNFGFKVASTVKTLTKKDGQKYSDFIRNILTKDSKKIKIADICDNLNDNPSEHAMSKYLKALPILLDFGEW